MSARQQKIFFTGAGGRVGRRLLPLIRQSHPIEAVDVSEGPESSGPVTKMDLTNREQVLAGFSEASALIHCAIASGSPPSTGHASEEEELRYNENMIEVNMRGTYYLFEAARVHRIPRVVFISSLTAALGRGRLDQLDPDTIASPVNFYACTKLFGEQLAEVYYREHGISTIILRLGQPYPMGLDKEKEWATDRQATALFVTFPDIARAVHAALATKVKFGRYNIVSLHPNQVTVESGREIGFHPQDCWQSAQPSAPSPLLKA